MSVLIFYTLLTIFLPLVHGIRIAVLLHVAESGRLCHTGSKFSFEVVIVQIGVVNWKVQSVGTGIG